MPCSACDFDRRKPGSTALSQRWRCCCKKEPIPTSSALVDLRCTLQSNAAINTDRTDSVDEILDFLSAAKISPAAIPYNRYLLAAARADLLPVANKLLAKVTQAAVDKQGRDALWFAAYNKNIDLINLLVDSRLFVSRADALGRTALYVASESGCRDCVDKLASLGDVDKKTVSGNTALIAAARSGDAEVVALLLRRGADIAEQMGGGSFALFK